MTSLALLFTLSAIGISETVYLIKQRINTQGAFCVIGQGCMQVLESKWRKIFIIPNDILGLFFYISTSSISAFLVIGLGPPAFWNTLLELAVGVGALMSIFFTYLQWRVLRSWCFWCLMSACTIWLMGIVILVSNINQLI